MAVHLHGSPRDFDSAVGLMGDFHTSQMLARDGIVHDVDDFVAEWQVHGDEDKLFRTLRAPQHPHATCRLVLGTVTKDARRRRHLREDRMFVSAAEAACAKSNKGTKQQDFEFCVHDVLVTNDLGMAEVW
jgi:hypothetical protein